MSDTKAALKEPVIGALNIDPATVQQVEKAVTNTVTNIADTVTNDTSPVDLHSIMRWLALFGIGAAVYTISKDQFITLIAVPTLTALGGYSAAVHVVPTVVNKLKGNTDA